MNQDCNSDALEALVRDEPLPASFDREAIEAHVARCEQCANELAWLRAEYALFAKTNSAPPSVEYLWPEVEKKLPAPKSAESPYRTASPPLVARPARRWGTYAALAASFAALATISTFTVYRNTRSGSSATHTINASGREATLRVSGPLSIRIETASADVRIDAGPSDRVRVLNVGGDKVPSLVRAPDGHYDVLFDRRNLGSGRVEIELPARSSIEVVTASGDVFIGEVGGSTKVRTSSGDVEVRSASDAAIETSSGEVELRAATGPIAIHTVSGDIHARSTRPATDVSLHSTSGSLAWRGACGAGCRMNARSNSGDVELAFAEASGATVRYTTTSGSVDDRVDGVEAPLGDAIVRRFGSGAGSIDVSTTSGSMTLLRAR